MESPCTVHSNLVPDTRRSLARATRGQTTWPLLESVVITTHCLTFSVNVNFPNRSEAESNQLPIPEPHASHGIEHVGVRRGYERFGLVFLGFARWSENSPLISHRCACRNRR